LEINGKIFLMIIKNGEKGKVKGESILGIRYSLYSEKLRLRTQSSISVLLSFLDYLELNLET
jgi:hypothetical protein